MACPVAAWGEEAGAFEVQTGVCEYGSFAQPVSEAVRAGETLARIASRYGLTIAALVAANELTSPDRISVGLQLSIPGPVQARE